VYDTRNGVNHAWQRNGDSRQPLKLALMTNEELIYFTENTL
jgi:hypothetical protein